MEAMAKPMMTAQHDPAAARRFFSTTADLVGQGVQGANILHSSFLTSAGETQWANLLNNVVTLLDTPITIAAGEAAQGRLTQAGNALRMYTAYFRYLNGVQRAFLTSWKTGHGLVDVDHLSMDMLERMATRDENGKLLPQSDADARVWTLNDGPLLQAIEQGNPGLAAGLRRAWQVGTSPLRFSLSADAAIKYAAGNAFEFTRQLPIGLDVAKQLSQRPEYAYLADPAAAWKWANQYADNAVKRQMRDLSVNGQSITDAVMTSPYALQMARHITFQDDIVARMEWEMPDPVTGSHRGRSMERGLEIAKSRKIQGEEAQQQFAINYVKGYIDESTGEAVSAGTAMEDFAAGMQKVARVANVGNWPFELLNLGRQDHFVGALVNAIQPFVRIGSNIEKRALRKTFVPLGPVPVPGALFVDTWWRDIVSADPMVRANAVGDVAMSGAAAVGVIGVLQSGAIQIAGNGPVDPVNAKIWRKTHQPLSVRARIGWDEEGNPTYTDWLSIRWAEPWASWLGNIADYLELQDNLAPRDREKYADTITADLFWRVQAGQLNRSWNAGIAEWIQAATDLGTAAADMPNKQDRLAKAFRRLVAGYVVPQALYSTRRIDDPTIRGVEPGGSPGQQIVDEIKNRVPFWSSTIPAQRDTLTGEEVRMSGFWGSQTLPMENPVVALGMGLAQLLPTSPLKLQKQAKGAWEELARVQTRANAAFTGMVTPSDFGSRYRLSNEQYNLYVQDVAKTPYEYEGAYKGKTLLQAVNDVINSPEYQSYSYYRDPQGNPSGRYSLLNPVFAAYKNMGMAKFLARTELDIPKIRSGSDAAKYLKGQLQDAQKFGEPSLAPPEALLQPGENTGKRPQQRIKSWSPTPR